MPRKPVDQISAGQRFFTKQFPGMDTEYFGALWHLFTVGHLVATDLDGIARRKGVSFADLDLLGIVAMDEQRALRATDIASALYVSDAVISTRVQRLRAAGLLERRRSGGDQRAFELSLTPAAHELLADAIALIEGDAKIVRFYRRLSDEDRAHLRRILGLLHGMYDREFAGTPYFSD